MFGLIIESSTVNVLLGALLGVHGWLILTIMRLGEKVTKLETKVAALRCAQCDLGD